MKSEIPTLMEFGIKKDLLIKALLHVSNVATVAHVGILITEDKRKVGITITNYSSELKDSEFKTKLHADFAISDDEMINPKFSTGDHPWFLVSCHTQFINSIGTLPAKNEDILDVRLVQVKVNDTDLIESQTIISGKHNITVGSRIRHPQEEIPSGWSELSHKPPSEMFS
jgi:hypothetical protein